MRGHQIFSESLDDLLAKYLIDEEWIHHLDDSCRPLTLYYDFDSNRFIEGMTGDMIVDIYKIVSPAQILVFKKKKKDCCFRSVSKAFDVWLIYPYWYRRAS